MDDNNLTVPYIVYEGELARAERMNKRLWVLIILLICLLVGSNGAWLYYESQFIEESVTQEVDTGDGTAVVTGIGDISYGESETDS